MPKDKKKKKDKKEVTNDALPASMQKRKTLEDPFREALKKEGTSFKKAEKAEQKAKDKNKVESKKIQADKREVSEKPESTKITDQEKAARKQAFLKYPDDPFMQQKYLEQDPERANYAQERKQFREQEEKEWEQRQLAKFDIGQREGEAPPTFQQAQERVYQGDQAQSVEELIEQEKRTDDVQRFLDKVEKERKNLEPTLVQQEQKMREASGMGAGTSFQERSGLETRDTIESQVLGGWEKMKANTERTFGKLGWFDFTLNDLMDVAQNPENLQDLQGTVSQVAQNAAAIEGAASTGAISPERAMAEIDQKSQDLEILEDRINKVAAQQPSLKTNGEYVNAMQEIETARDDLRERRAKVLEKVRERPEFDEDETARILAKMQKINEDREAVRKGSKKLKRERQKQIIF